MSNCYKLLVRCRCHTNVNQICNSKSRFSIHLRTVYSGPESIKNFAKEHTFGDSWEEKKLSAIRNKVIKKCNGEDQDEIIDEGTRILYDLPHLITTNHPEDYHVEGFEGKMLGNASESNNSKCVNENNLNQEFARPDVQEILLKITGKETDKVFKRKLGNIPVMPAIRYLTTEQLEKEYSNSLEEAENLLEMPPYMNRRENCDEILSDDSALNGYENHRVVFTDISEDKKDRERFVVVREPNGVLRKAFWEERDRILQIYYPKKGRDILTPTLFKNVEVALHNGLHISVMENVLIQFEPDSTEFIDLSQQVYDDINEKGIYDIFRSTRFFGGMAFYLTSNENIDGLLREMIGKSLISDAASLINMFYLLHPKNKAQENKNSQCSSDEQIIEEYIANEDKKETQLGNYFKEYLESLQSKEDTS